MLRIGGTGWLSGLSLPALLQLQTEAATVRPAKAKACIFFMLEGGPSHIDMWDLKPTAPVEIRGPFNPISTVVPGTQISNLLPLSATIADKYTILRSHSHADNAHQTGRHWLLTGILRPLPTARPKASPSTNSIHPSVPSFPANLGRVVRYRPMSKFPLHLGQAAQAFTAAKYAPFTIDNDPVQADFRVRDLDLPKGITEDRFSRRQQLLNQSEQLGAAAAASGRVQTLQSYYEKAVDLVTSPEARCAFDLQSEDCAVRERYGMSSIGQCALMARRLVEAGCRFIGIEHGSWDTHFDNFTSHEKLWSPHRPSPLRAPQRPR
jgi:hypothetical protein